MISNFEPVRIDTSEQPIAERDRVPIFYIDEVEYTAPRVASGSMAWRALELLAERGPGAAAHHMMIEALGDKAMTALKSCEQISIEENKRILGGLAAAYWGQLKDMVDEVGKAAPDMPGS